MDEDHKGIRQIADALRALADRLQTEAPINSLVVFGSRSRGDFLVHSDADIAVVSPAFDGLPTPERIGRILIHWEGPVALEAVGLTPDELHACEGPLCWEILEDGVAVLDDGTFQKAREHFRKTKCQRGLRKTEYGWRIGARS